MKALAVRLAVLSAVLAMLWAAPAAAQGDPSFVTFSAGAYDFNRQKAPAYEFGMQYRSDLKLWIFQPMIGFMHNSNSSNDIYAGISLDVFFGNRIVFRPSFAFSYYNRNGGENLGYPLEFRSGAELAYRFDDRSRLGVELYHMSNAHLGTTNPGEESINLVYSLPTTKIREWFGN